MKFIILSLVYKPSTTINVHGIKKQEINKLIRENKIIEGSNGSYVALIPPQTILTINCNNGTILNFDVYCIIKDLTRGINFDQNFIEYLNLKLINQKYEKDKNISFTKKLRQILYDAI